MFRRRGRLLSGIVWRILGMGGLLPSGELFVVMIFSKVKITREVAAMFRTLSVKLVLLPFAGGRIFAGT